MIEIFLFIYCSSLLLSGLLLAWNLHSVYKQIQSSELAVINANLKKINYFWSVTNDAIQNLEPNSIGDDTRSAYRSCLLMGLLGFASLPGFLLFLVLTLSLSLVKNRFKNDLFKSPLTTTPDLSAETIQTVIQNLKK